MRLCSPLPTLSGIAVVLASGCAQPTQTYRLGQRPHAPTVTGSLTVERLDRGQHLLVVQLEQLPPPEHVGPGLRRYVVWLEDAEGGQVEVVGTLRYDRNHRSGNLLATTDLDTFTVRVTGERDEPPRAPSPVLLAERRVATN